MSRVSRRAEFVPEGNGVVSGSVKLESSPMGVSAVSVWRFSRWLMWSKAWRGVATRLRRPLVRSGKRSVNASRCSFRPWLTSSMINVKWSRPRGWGCRGHADGTRHKRLSHSSLSGRARGRHQRLSARPQAPGPGLHAAPLRLPKTRARRGRDPPLARGEPEAVALRDNGRSGA